MDRKIPSQITQGFEYASQQRKLLAGIAQLFLGWLGALFLGTAILGFVAGPGRSPEHIPSLLFTAMLFLLCILLIRRGGRNLRDYRTGKGWAGEDSRSVPTAPSATKAATPWVAHEQTTGYTDATSPVGSDRVSVVKVKCESCGAVVIPDEDGRCEYCGTRLI